MNFTEIAENRHIAAYFGGDRLSQRDAASLYDNIDILARSAKETIPYKTAYDKGTNAKLCRSL